MFFGNLPSGTFGGIDALGPERMRLHKEAVMLDIIPDAGQMTALVG